METLIAPKKGAFTSENNPKKPKAGSNTFLGFEIDPKQRYRFQLIETYENMKPRDSVTNEISDSPYPPIKMLPNAGVAFWESKMRRWQYVFGYPTIWVDEQVNPIPDQIQIADHRNDLNFRDGNLFVNGSDTAKMMAMIVQDEFDKNDNPITQVTKAFRIINDTDSINIAAAAGDKAYEAETAARNATTAELLPLGLLFGVNIDSPDEREDIIRKEIQLKARQLPDAFLKNFVAPKTKIKYLITKALQENIINADSGSVTITESGRVLFGIDLKADVAEQISAMIMANDEEATLLYAQIQKVLS